MKNMSKALVGTAVAGAMAMSSASPAFAQYRHYDRDRGGVSVGDVIAGALIIGGIAAVASAASKNDRGGYYRDDDYRYDRAGYGNGNGYNYGYRGNPRQAVERCVSAAERYASQRYSRADVTDIRQVRDTRDGYEVRGRIAVDTRRGDWRQGDGYYGNGWGGDYRGWNQSMRGYDSGTFKCQIERGRVVDIDMNGVRGL